MSLHHLHHLCFPLGILVGVLWHCAESLGVAAATTPCAAGHWLCPHTMCHVTRLQLCSDIPCHGTRCHLCHDRGCHGTECATLWHQPCHTLCHATRHQLCCDTLCHGTGCAMTSCAIPTVLHSGEYFLFESDSEEEEETAVSEEQGRQSAFQVGVAGGSGGHAS